MTETTLNTAHAIEGILMDGLEAGRIYRSMSEHLADAYELMFDESMQFRFAGMSNAQQATVAATLAGGLAQLHAAAIVAQALKRHGKG